MTLTINDLFDSRFYLAQYKDVADAVNQGIIGDPLWHFVNFGQLENRSPSALFNTSFYLQQNQDVAFAIAEKEEESAPLHFIRHGQFERRNPSLLFDDRYYLQTNPDVLAALNEETIGSSFEHFIKYGQFEGRTPSNQFNPNYYLARNPDVKQAVETGIFSNAFQHYITHGQYEGRAAVPGTNPGSFLLQLLHASDQEGGVPALDDAPRFSSVLNALRAQYPDRTLILSSGDNYIPGPFFAASSDPTLRSVLGREDIGRGDIAILNSMGFQASAFGNHEFDQGTRQVRTLIAQDRGYPGTAFPYLSANLDFSTDSNLRDLVVTDNREASTIPNSIAKSTVITVGGEKVGIVGATTPTLPSISSPGDVRVLPANAQDLDALAATIQPSIDGLISQGINKVILLAHMQQLDIEVNLASRLRGVDIIVAGGSHTLLNDSTDRLRVGDTSGGVYPILRTSVTGEPIAIVNTTSNYKYVGRLVAEFDPQGILIPESIDPNNSGAYATDSQGVIDTGNFPSDPKVVEVTDALRNVIVSKDTNIFGQTNVYLNGERNSVRTEETNLGNLTADANLAAARKVDPTVVISIKNGGGIRESIGAVIGAGGNDPNAGQKIPPVANPAAGKEAGEISQLDIENSLRFNNQLSLLTLTARQLQQVIEHGVADTAPGRTPGRFPQVGGMAFAFDPNLPPGNRVLSLTVRDGNGNVLDTIVQNGQLVGNPDRTFRIVTLNFLAGGGDSYPFPDFPATNPVDTGIGEQTALQNYLAENFANNPYSVPDVDPSQDTRIRNLAAPIPGTANAISREITSISDQIIGTINNDVLMGDGGENLIQGGADPLTSGNGADIFVYEMPGESGNVITDFSFDDVFKFSAAGFGVNITPSLTPILGLPFNPVVLDPLQMTGLSASRFE